MALDLAAPANYLVNRLNPILRTQMSAPSDAFPAQRGVPLASKWLISAAVTLGSITIAPYSTQNLLLDVRYWVLLAYRLSENHENVDAAEAALMTLAGLFIEDLYSDQTLGGTCAKIEVSTAVAEEPEYILMRGREHREYPFLITATMYDQFSLA